MLLTNTEVEVRGTSDTLVVALHAWAASSVKLVQVRSAVEEALPNSDLLFPDYPASILSAADPVEITEALVDCIADAVRKRNSKGGSYKEIVLMGHSLGALLVRKAYVFARGQNQDHSGSLRPATQPWAAMVSRIILLAGTNRGWDLRKKAKRLSLFRWFGFVLGASLWRWFRLGGLINAVRQGAPFIANLRIQWIQLVRDSSPAAPVPLTVQLLGTVDDVVDESDNVDVQSGAYFVYKSVPETGHVNVVDFSGPIGQKRKSIFLDALLTDADKLVSDKTVDFRADKAVDQVVFIMHGIRDFGLWSGALASSVKAEAKARSMKVRIITSDYGYFPMMGFLFQPERQKNVRWFMDQYTEALARYPRAKVSFIGHSNGTYLLASAVERYKACSFDRAVFAGSVVNRHFPWGRYIAEKRVSALQNYVASGDLVVAMFPAVFERIGKARADLGSAGHTGFAFRDPPIYQLTFIKGGHNAAIVPENFGCLASFVLGDDAAIPSGSLVAGRQSRGVVWFGKFCVPIFGLLLMVAVLPLWLLILSHYGIGAPPSLMFTTIWFAVLFAILRLA